ncbi:hypothetical protein EWM64_g10023 [Hericium alpestre]|uniref:Uncharacterized protein n=1 Tax=Hericium alpestre TaxID=135208 RepID=A0A4Y9ZIF4_9AGAM|nr:hypothetical protein EWM64_g10023 [Hericium alpestre]
MSSRTNESGAGKSAESQNKPVGGKTSESAAGRPTASAGGKTTKSTGGTTTKLAIGKRKRISKHPASSTLRDPPAKRAKAVETPTIVDTRGPLPAKPGETSFREYYHKVVKKRYPDVQVKDDLHLYWLALGGLEKKPFKTVEQTTEESARRWMQSNKSYRTLDEARQAVIKFRIGKLNSPATVIGVKPDVDEIDDVHYAPVLDSHLDIRIWGNSPGLDRMHLYCLDFVDRASRQPVNAPSDFELCAVPSLVTPWLSMDAGRITSMEHNFGKHSKDIRPGQEKFGVMEGSSFKLKRVGHPEVLYNVPLRPNSPPPDWAKNLTVLSFTPATK